MARGINKVILVGTLGGDPETKYTGAGSAVVNISIATNESWADKNSGEKQERTEWHKIVAFNRLAEIMGQYLQKGSQVYIEGKLQTDKWTDAEGVERYATKIIANEMQMLGGQPQGQQNQQNNQQNNQQQNQQNNQQGQQSQNNGGYRQNQGQNQAPPQRQPSKKQNYQQQNNQPQNNQPQNNQQQNEDFDDDIPF